MSDSQVESTQLDDEQIKELVHEFSKYEVNSQTFYESQNQTFHDDQQEQLPNASFALPDFQAEFLKCMFSATDMAKNARVCSGTQQYYDSQTDVEAVIQTYMTGNPNWSENVPSKPLDIQAFLEARDFFVTIKSGTSNNHNADSSLHPSSSSSMSTANQSRNRFTLGPLPLEIEDIHHIKIDANEVRQWSSYQTIYAQKFKTVMFYGRCKPVGSVAAQKHRNVKLYEVDDGSSMAIVHFPHFQKDYSSLSYGIERLTEEYALAKREGISYLGSENCHPSKSKCKETLQNINMLINIMRRTGSIKQEFLTHGSKVCVIGRAFAHCDGKTHIFAYQMIEDAHMNRDFEIKFKKHLISVYETKYLKFKTDGSIKAN